MMGGWRVVGENGPELEATGRSRIFNASQTSQIFGGSNNSDVVIELRAVREELAELKRVAMLDAEMSNNQREQGNSALEKIAGNTDIRAAGVGGANFAKRP